MVGPPFASESPPARVGPLAESLHALGVVAREEGDAARAQELLGESLTLMREIGHRQGITSLLEDLAAVASSADEPTRAAVLLGASAVLREALGAIPKRDEKSRLDAATASARARLGEGPFADAFATGRALDFEAAALLLAIVGLYLLGELARISKLEDCLMQGRMNCARVEIWH